MTNKNKTQEQAPIYKQNWFLTIVGLVLLIVFGIPSYLALHKTKRPLIATNPLEITIDPNQKLIETYFSYENIGEIPVYVRTIVDGATESGKVKHEKPENSENIMIIMPKQIFKRQGIIIIDKVYDKILNNTFSGNLWQSIKIEYSAKKKNVGEFYTYQKFKLDKDDLPGYFKGKSDSTMWTLVESDFK